MLTFLTQLFETGEIVVPRHGSTGDQLEDVQKFLLKMESIVRKDWHGTPPQFDIDVAGKAAEVLLIFCQATVYRDLDQHEIQTRIDRIGLIPQPIATCHYSADLALQFVPDVRELLTRSAKEDPVLQLLATFAKPWPFSAIGIPNTLGADLPDFIVGEEMFPAFVDRVIARRDSDRAGIPIVSEAIQAVVGDFPTLVPWFSASSDSSFR